MNRRRFLMGMGALGLGLSGCAVTKYWPKPGLMNPCLSGLPDDLKNHPLMQQIWAGIDAAQVWDSHVHLVGVGGENSQRKSDVWVNPNMDSWLHPILKVQKKFYINGACADYDDGIVARMVQISAEMPAGFKSMLFAFDWFHDENGQPSKEHSIFHISNNYAAEVASTHAQYFEWVASIHPYRKDAVDALDEAHAKGARAIKWLPSGMGIDPASTKCDAFYKKLAALNMPIISHTGRESAVQGGDQSHGNPLKMRRALDRGVRVALAHCASDGDDEDLDNDNKRIKSFALFTRMMDDANYKNLCFGEISALTLINHTAAIKPILARGDWHNRLLNGSDYPLPAIMPLISPMQLLKQNLLEETHLDFLHAIRTYNPLMFDFAVKRLIRFEGNSFSAQVFETKKFFHQTISNATSNASVVLN